MTMAELRLQLRLLLPDGKTFGPGKAELLELIEQHGSIAAAGREMKMSYKRAWTLVEEMNAAFAEPLVIAGRGGAAHGGAQVTDLGRAVLARYRGLLTLLETDGREAMDFVALSLAPLQAT
jgi:molybdate transport system regulatory protein